MLKKTKSVEVICAYTTPEMWKAIEQTNTAVQGNRAKDAEYIAFICTGTKANNGRGIITHYAKVKTNGIMSDVPIADYTKRVHGLEKYYEKKGWVGLCKTYDLEEMKKLPSPIYHQKGDAAKNNVKFYTTLEEFKKAKVLRDMKTVSQLEVEKKNNL